jgi:hypothetical protein
MNEINNMKFRGRSLVAFNLGWVRSRCGNAGPELPDCSMSGSLVEHLYLSVKICCSLTIGADVENFWLIVLMLPLLLDYLAAWREKERENQGIRQAARFSCVAEFMPPIVTSCGQCHVQSQVGGLARTPAAAAPSALPKLRPVMWVSNASTVSHGNRVLLVETWPAAPPRNRQRRCLAGARSLVRWRLLPVVGITSADRCCSKCAAGRKLPLWRVGGSIRATTLSGVGRFRR